MISYTLSNSNKVTVEINLIELASGKLITKQTSTKNEDTIQFSTENLASGIYLLSIYNNGISMRNSRVINIKYHEKNNFNYPILFFYINKWGSSIIFQ